MQRYGGSSVISDHRLYTFKPVDVCVAFFLQIVEKFTFEKLYAKKQQQQQKNMGKLKNVEYFKQFELLLHIVGLLICMSYNCRYTNWVQL